MDPIAENSAIRFLSFANDNEDAEKEAKLREAAQKIEEALAKERALNELVDYKPPAQEEAVDPSDDTRPLYERLLEQRNKKQEAHEEAHKLSNLVTKLDEEDVQYLNEVARLKREEEIKKRLEVHDALEQRKRVNERRSFEEEKRLKESMLNSKTSPKNVSQLKSKLSSMIKIRPKSEKSDVQVDSHIEAEPSDSDRVTRSQANKRPIGSSDSRSNETNRKSGADGARSNEKAPKRQRKSNKDQDGSGKEEEEEEANSERPTDQKACYCTATNVMKCIGVLPSLPLVSKFKDASDESDTSDEELDHRVAPRPRKHK